jgi:hypothetical protein
VTRTRASQARPTCARCMRPRSAGRRCEVLAWARDFNDDTPYEILRTHPGAAPGWLADLCKFCRGGAPETVSTTVMSLGLILKAMADDRVVDLFCQEAGEGLAAGKRRLLDRKRRSSVPTVTVTAIGQRPPSYHVDSMPVHITS